MELSKSGLPKDLKSEGLVRGQAHFLNSGSLTLVHWKDKRDVFCLSTIHGNHMEHYSTRRRDAEDVQWPVLISSYNTYMGGVDLMDQMLVYYAIGRKTIKWYKRVFWSIGYGITECTHSLQKVSFACIEST